VTQSTPPARTNSSKLPSFDPSVPNPARMWNYWLGGKDNFAADRELAERVLEAMPSMPLIARAARLFLIDAVHQLATEHGVRQFLDIGTGLPTADNTHDVAQRAAPEASAEMARRYNAMSSASITPRSRDQVARFFDGLDLLPPGLVPISQWGLSGQIDPATGGLVGYCAVARKR
jgi:hypothetical protein